jgi:hypothetical protein
MKDAHYCTPGGIVTAGAVSGPSTGLQPTYMYVEGDKPLAYHDIHLSQHDLLVLQGNRGECHLA